MSSRLAPITFRARRWFYAGQFVPLGVIGIFGLVLGPLLLSGIVHDASGETAMDAGIALTLVGAFMLLLALPPLYQFIHRSRPIMAIDSVGIHVRLIGDNSASAVPWIIRHHVALFIILFGVITRRAFQEHFLLIKWPQISRLGVEGSPLSRYLKAYDANTTPVLLVPQHELAHNLDAIADIIVREAAALGHRIVRV